MFRAPDIGKDWDQTLELDPKDKCTRWLKVRLCFRYLGKNVGKINNGESTRCEGTMKYIGKMEKPSRTKEAKAKKTKSWTVDGMDSDDLKSFAKIIGMKEQPKEPMKIMSAQIVLERSKAVTDAAKERRVKRRAARENKPKDEVLKLVSDAVEKPAKKQNVPLSIYFAYCRLMYSNLGISCPRPSGKDLAIIKRFIGRYDSHEVFLQMMEKVLSHWEAVRMKYKITGYPSIALMCSKFGESWIMEIQKGELKAVNTPKAMDEKERKGLEEATKKFNEGIDEMF